MSYPSWFSEKTGFQFYDPDDDLVIVLGYGGWRDIEVCDLISERVDNKEQHKIGTLFDMVMKPRTLVGAYLYKGEWHLQDLANRDQEYWDKSYTQ